MGDGVEAVVLLQAVFAKAFGEPLLHNERTSGSSGRANKIDVLVMGAYGHSKWREFILGGATKSLLSKPPLPILFSY